MKGPLQFIDDGRHVDASAPLLWPAGGVRSRVPGLAVRPFVRRHPASVAGSATRALPALEQRCPGLGTAYVRAVQEALVAAYDDEMHTSFSDPVNMQEVLHVLHAGTGQVIDRRSGTSGRVDGDDEDLARWSEAGPFIVAHTHVNSVPHSFTDLYTVYAANTHAGWVANTAMIVFGRDGSWYELRLPLDIDAARIEAIRREVEDERVRITIDAARAVDTQIASELGLGTLADDRGGGGMAVWIRQPGGVVKAHSRACLAAEAKAHGVDANGLMARFCQGPLTRMWQREARTHGFAFRFHHPPAAREAAA